jgi:hypothetical protein
MSNNWTPEADALLRQRDCVTLKKKLEREWASEAIVRLRRLEGLVKDYGHRLSLVEGRLKRVSKIQKETVEEARP